MINGINDGLQSALQSVAPKNEATQDQPAQQKVAQEPESVKVSLGQTQQAQEGRGVDDYRALAQKAALAKAQVEDQQAEQQQRNLTRDQAFLAAAAVRNNG